jgi:predicted phosphodiesterase
VQSVSVRIAALYDIHGNLPALEAAMRDVRRNAVEELVIGGDVDCFTRLTPDARLRRLVAGRDAPMVVCGHTHMQFDRRVGDVRVVNAGSVGMPFGAPGAYWLLLSSGVELRRTECDLVGASARIRATNYPQAEEFAAHNVLDPPSEDEMLEIFSRADMS